MSDQPSPSDLAYQEAERRVAEAIAGAATELDLSIEALTRIPPLDHPFLQANLQSLDVRGTAVSDLAPLATLTRLESLDVRNTAVSDLAPLATLTSLKSLSVSSTAVSDLAPLATLTSLNYLDVGSTAVSDLAPLATLTSLNYLDVGSTAVSDLAPLATLTGLERLDVSSTAVSDLAPLAALTSLVGLDVRSTTVADLGPLAGLTGLCDAAVPGAYPGQLGLGLHVSSANFPPPLRDFAKLNNPERTIKIINYLRQQQGLPEYYPPGYTPPAQTESASKPLPVLPVQGCGPHFGIGNDGVVRQVPSPPFDADGNDISRLRRLHPAVIEAARDLLAALGNGGANTYPALHARVRAYLQQLDQPLENLDFTRIYAEGLRLANARAAAERNIADGLAPPLEDSQFEALKSLSTLHGVFISGSAKAQALLADAERFDTPRDEIEATNRDVVDLVRPLLDRDDIVERAAPQQILDIANEGAPVPHPERRAAYTIAATSNLLIVFGGYALFGYVVGHVVEHGYLLQHVTEALAGPAAHSALAERGKDARRFAQTLLSDATDWTDTKVQAALRSGSAATRAYILSQEPLLRRLAARSPRFAFLTDILDWLKKHGD